MKREIIHIDELCCRCGFFAYNEPETHNDNDYGCEHPDNLSGYKMCMASACPLGHLAEEDDFISIEGCDKEEAKDNARQDDYVVIEIEE